MVDTDDATHACVGCRVNGDGLRYDLAALRRRAAAAPAPRAAAPPDVGRIIARVPRTDGTELRVSVHEYQGKPFVRVGPWQSNAPDAWPVKGKGTTVKVRELGALAAGLLDALDAINESRDDDGR